ncbi:hypothetical protein GALL_308340 [mine drainage metagenome]|jgi:hypothetical protein|uniref:Uncharacterized protein n=1 Tax=mine drainage metagenome TaxID=410659 RepID=A0A1J5RCC6_9ZZZZ
MAIDPFGAIGAVVLSRGTPMSMDDAVDGLMEVEKVLVDILQAGSRNKDPV